MKLNDKVALVVSSGQGIGEGISLCMAQEGTHVFISDINLDNAQKVAEKVEAFGCKALAVKADLTEERGCHGLNAENPCLSSLGFLF